MTTKHKLTGKLKRFIDVGKVETRVIGPTERWVLSSPSNNSKLKLDGYLHPSKIIKSMWCHRTSYFELLGHADGSEYNSKSIKQYMVFQQGHHIHSKWQTIFKNMDKIYGLWKCSHCGLKEWGMHSEVSNLCIGPWEYKEVPIVHEPLKLKGHADGILKGFKDPLLLEIKSIGPGTIKWEHPDLLNRAGNSFENAWKLLDGPFASHILQAQLYLKMLELSGKETPQEAIFIYESKLDGDVKEFVMPKDDFGVDEVIQNVKNIINAIETGVPPMCNLRGEERCGQCKEYDNVINQVNS